MNQTAILWPMIAHVALVYAVYVLLWVRRVGAVRAGAAKVEQFRNRRDEPEASVAVANNIANQFELPMLFHSVCLALYVTAGASILPVVVAWLFIISRYAHAYVHVTSNRLRYRARLFRVGFWLVAALWVWLALHLAGAI